MLSAALFTADISRARASLTVARLVITSQERAKWSHWWILGTGHGLAVSTGEWLCQSIPGPCGDGSPRTEPERKVGTRTRFFGFAGRLDFAGRPGAYDVAHAPILRAKNAPSFSMGSRTFVRKAGTSTPGPGAYRPKKPPKVLRRPPALQRSHPGSYAIRGRQCVLPDSTRAVATLLGASASGRRIGIPAAAGLGSTKRRAPSAPRRCRRGNQTPPTPSARGQSHVIPGA